MYITKIKYKNFNDEDREMEACFHMSEAEIIDYGVEVPGGLGGVIKKITEEHDTKSLAKVMKDLIVRSYGIKSDDGNRFIKNQQILDEFMQTPAYSEFYMTLATNDKIAADFFNGIIPKKLRDRVEKDGMVGTATIATMPATPNA